MMSAKKKIAILFNNARLRKLLASQKGVTLTEMLIAVSILGILAAIGANPFLEWNKERKVTRDGRNFYSSMQLAKLAAIKNDCNVVVTINPGADSYTYFKDDGGDDGTGTRGNGVQDGTELTLATTTVTSNIDVPGAGFAGGNTTGFTSRGTILNNNSGDVVFSRPDLTNANKVAWYRVRMAVSGHLLFQASYNSSNGIDGTWERK